MTRRGLFRFLAAAPVAVAATPAVANGLTETWRQMLDAGMFGNFPGMLTKNYERYSYWVTTSHTKYKWVAAPGVELKRGSLLLDTVVRYPVGEWESFPMASD